MTPKNIPPSAAEWVETTLSTLDVDQLVGQMLNPLLTCPWEPSPTPEERLEEALNFQVGAAFVCCDKSNAETRELIERFRNGSPVPPLVCADIELSSPLKDVVRFGGNMNLGAVAGEARAAELAYECGRYNAILANSVGINWSFGPVVDLPLNYDNPMCGARNYSRDPDRVATLANALVNGMQEHGLGATLKHFPGDGTDDRDQHLVTPVNDLDFEVWKQTYGKTFGDGIANGAYSIMMGHIALLCRSSRDPRTGTLMPATLDSKIQVELLRDEMGFQGVIVSDAIAMGGAVSHCRNVADAAIRNILTGSDMVLFVRDLGEVVAGVKAAVDRGDITLERLRESVRRILTMKAKLGLPDNDYQALPAETAAAEHEKARAVSREIAEKSVTLVRDCNHALPLKLPGGATILVCLLPKEVGEGEGMLLPDEIRKEFESSYLDRELKNRGFKVVCVGDRHTMAREAEDADAIIFVSNTRPEAGRGSIRLSRIALRWINFSWDIINSDRPVLFISMGNPYVLREIPDMPTFICTYSQSPDIARATVKAIVGELDFAGELPVDIPLFS